MAVEQKTLTLEEAAADLRKALLDRDVVMESLNAARNRLEELSRWGDDADRKVSKAKRVLEAIACGWN